MRMHREFPGYYYAKAQTTVDGDSVTVDCVVRDVGTRESPNYKPGRAWTVDITCHKTTENPWGMAQVLVEQDYIYGTKREAVADLDTMLARGFTF